MHRAPALAVPGAAVAPAMASDLLLTTGQMIPRALSTAMMQGVNLGFFATKTASHWIRHALRGSMDLALQEASMRVLARGLTRARPWVTDAIYAVATGAAYDRATLRWPQTRKGHYVDSPVQLTAAQRCEILAFLRTNAAWALTAASNEIG